MSSNTPEYQSPMELARPRRPLDGERLNKISEELNPVLNGYLENVLREDDEEHRLAFAVAIAQLLEKNDLDARVSAIEALLYAVEAVASKASIDTVDASSPTTLTRAY